MVKEWAVIHFIVHGAKDSVAVAVVDLKKGQALSGWDMERDRTVRLKAKQDVPLGHKIALADIAEGNPVIKYGEVIGKAVKAIGKGRHVHTHNLKTARW